MRPQIHLCLQIHQRIPRHLLGDADRDGNGEVSARIQFALDLKEQILFGLSISASLDFRGTSCVSILRRDLRLRQVDQRGQGDWIRLLLDLLSVR
jgi:hypothetical protein